MNPILPISMRLSAYSKQYGFQNVTGLQNFLCHFKSATTCLQQAILSRVIMKLTVKDSGQDVAMEHLWEKSYGGSQIYLFCFF